MSLKRLKRARQHSPHSEHTVFGYTRIHETEHKLNVPALVKYLCLNYYFIDDHFAEHDEGFTLDATLRSAKYAGSEPSVKWFRHGVYGDLNLLENDELISEYRWTFRLPDDPANGDFGFRTGIEFSSNTETKKYVSMCYETHGYMHRFVCTLLSYGADSQSCYSYDEHHCDYKRGSNIVEMIFEKKAGILSFRLNGKDIESSRITKHLYEGELTPDEWDQARMHLHVESVKPLKFELVKFDIKHI